MSGIKYLLVQSRTIIDINNHIISSGSYTKFVNWLKSLAIEQEPLPKGLLFIAFDNEQQDNKKCTCPKCNKKLDILAVLQTKSTKELTQVNKNIPSQSGTLIIKIYKYAQEKASYLEYINVVIPEIHVLDSLEVNPNLLNNVKKVLEHIQSITEINEGTRKWLPVICDGVSYNLVQKIKNDFLWLILISKALHKEMNMLKKYLLSEQLKNFSSLACKKRIIFINEAFKNNKQSLLPQPIPITTQEEEAAMSEKNMKKDNLLVLINSLLNSINISDHPKYCELKQKTHSQLLEILQSIKNLYNDQDEPENEIEPENK
ncbi:8158_t:CDS:2 [Scutellospora calospora]|uniref:8158_t:CDS:1 n=1 Tax=Scutellospora calospora TaxID=85575 RepID=A0ACA9LDW6_9GLOM|nr:8158_t:CDS:2 [Scutellospora calospora]